MWLMKKSLVEAIENARAQALEPPATIMAAFDRERSMASSGGDPRIFKRAGDVAEIVIQGALTPKPDWYAYWMCGGNTAYPEIIQSLALAAADQGIKRVVLNVSSPGGYVDGLFDCLAALESFSKPKETIASMADSAAYAIACLGGKITARNKSSEFGSVGVCATFVRYDGVNIYDIVSSHAPNKRPDPSTKEGQAVIREGLDAFEELFLDVIARGRGTTVKDITKNFGQGGVFLATAALDAGMIDAISGVELRADPVEDIDDEPEPDEGGEQDEGGDEGAARGGKGRAAAVTPKKPASPPPAALAATPNQPTTAAAAPPSPAPAAPAPQPNAPAVSGGAPTRTRKQMDENQLQAEHPALYSAVLNKGKADAKAAADAAIAEEKDRIEAHLTAGEQSGDMKTAIASIRSGAKMTQTLMTTYMMAGMKTRDVAARTEDDAAAAAATGGAAGKEPATKSFFDKVADAVESQAKGGIAA